MEPLFGSILRRRTRRFSHPIMNVSSLPVGVMDACCSLGGFLEKWVLELVLTVLGIAVSLIGARGFEPPAS